MLIEKQTLLFSLLISNCSVCFPGYKPALEGRSIINLQMSDTFAAFQDINAAVKVNPTAELLTNRGVIHQVTLGEVTLDYWLAVVCHIF